MFTLVRNRDGSFTYRTRGPVSAMDRHEARRALAGLRPLLQELWEAAHPGEKVAAVEEEGDLLRACLENRGGS